MVLSTNQTTWQFFAYHADAEEGAEPLSDHEHYPTSEAAYTKAQQFIDRQIIRTKIDAVLDPLVESGTLHPSAYACLLRLIGQLMRL
ncbi:hypothetical protein IFO70_10190 [Phormidium tenue FACHB-886]|nr:hypothetical protein [Phormidium tenue FACHB-886]